MAILYKAVRPNGSSFHDPGFRWLPEDGVLPEGGWLVEHPYPDLTAGASRYLSASTEPADCTGFYWPCRLLLVEPVGGVVSGGAYRHKRRMVAARVVGEVEAWRALGPNGQQVVEYLQILANPKLDWDAVRVPAREPARDSAWVAVLEAAPVARDAALIASRDAAWDVARVAAVTARLAARVAATALVMRDLITPDQFATLTAGMQTAGINFDTLEVSIDGEPVSTDAL